MGDNFKDQFRAAKAARTAVKPSKDQLKALKAQKAAAAAQQQATTAAVGRDEDTKSMPPPPPRPASLPPPSAPLQKPSDAAGPGSYHQDSQGTRINDGGGITASRLQSEPSVNKQIAPQHNINNINNNNNTSLVDSNTPLPTGFFEAAVAAQGGQGSTGGGLSLERVVSKGAKSGEGSTGAALGGIDRAEMRSGASVGDFLVATSQLSAMEETELNQIAPAISHALQAETSQQKIIQSNNKKDKNIVVERPGTSSKQQQLPNGFFDTASIAPQGTKASAAAGVSTQDGNMEKEFANFMKEVNVNAAQTEAEVGAEAAGAVEDDDEGDRRARDDFEQFVRMERLREVKEATKTVVAATNGATEYETALEEKPTSVLDIAGVVADDVLPPPKLVLPKKRKVAETVAILEREGSDDSGDEEEEDGAGMIDWRAKKSVKK